MSPATLLSAGGATVDWLERRLAVPAAELVWNESMLVCTLWGSPPSGFIRFVTPSNFFAAATLRRFDVAGFPDANDEVDVDDVDEEEEVDTRLAPRAESLLEAVEAPIVEFTARSRFVAETTLMEPPAGLLAGPSAAVAVGSTFLLLMSCSAPRLRLRVSREASSSESPLAMTPPPAAAALLSIATGLAEEEDTAARTRAGGCSFSMLVLALVLGMRRRICRRLFRYKKVKARQSVKCRWEGDDPPVI